MTYNAAKIQLRNKTNRKSNRFTLQIGFCKQTRPEQWSDANDTAKVALHTFQTIDDL